MIDSKVHAILPAPFDWIEIPSGSVKVNRKTETLPAFHISKYPITNAQYAKFIEADGYNKPEWWTTEGWQARNQGIAYDSVSKLFKPSGKVWTQPRCWHVSRWTGVNYPVIGVSWYEAVAFCLWLSAISGEKIMLPSEQQWQRAAQGDDRRAYPWGNIWDGKRCRNSVRRYADGTSPVTHYQGLDKGESPFGVVDMTGNTCEWCATDYNTGNNDIYQNVEYRSGRGGSWALISAVNFRVGKRYYANPDWASFAWGFRVSRSK